MPVERVRTEFKDVSMTFQSNPLNYDLIALKNESAIARSLRNIVFTLPEEKFFNPAFGTNIQKSLFNNIDDLSSSVIKDQVRSSIQTYEPRVALISVEVNPDFDDNTFQVTLLYRIIGADVTPQKLQFALQSSR